jgi:hypothetical protein
MALGAPVRRQLTRSLLELATGVAVGVAAAVLYRRLRRRVEPRPAAPVRPSPAPVAAAASADERLRESLRVWLAEEPVRSARAAALRQPRGPVRAASAAGAVVVALAVGVSAGAVAAGEGAPLRAVALARAAHVASPPRAVAARRLSWPQRPGATYYRVELYRAGEKVLELWSDRPSVVVPARWVYESRRYAASGQPLDWQVQPVLASAGQPRLGGVLRRASLDLRR